MCVCVHKASHSYDYTNLHNMFYRVLITTTDTSQNPTRLEFFNNFDDSDLGKGLFNMSNLTR